MSGDSPKQSSSLALVPAEAKSLTSSAAENPDRRLALDARRGDREAFASLYNRHKKVVNAVSLARVPIGDAADLVQEVFAAALRRIDTVREPEKIAGFLVGLARRIAAGYWRNRRPTEELGDADIAVAEDASDKTLAGQVLSHIRELPEAYRLPLILRLVEDMTGPEIAEATGLTPGSVRVNLHRGMKQLRQSLKVEKVETDDEQ